MFFGSSEFPLAMFDEGLQVATGKWVVSTCTWDLRYVETPVPTISYP